MIPMDSTPEFAKYPDGLVPTIVQHHRDGRVLMLGFMSADALETTRRTGLVTFHSRSKGRLWTKGETSGHTLRCERILTDCDNDTLLVLAEPNGPTCHTGTESCFGGENNLPGQLHHLERTIAARVAQGGTASYTARLLASGINKVAQKVGEEAVELVIEAKDDDPLRFLNESADLLYHFLVLLAAKGVKLGEVEGVLRRREG